LLIDSVPTDNLDFIRVDVAVYSLACKLIKVPDAHGLIRRTGSQVLLLVRVERDGHHSVGVSIIRLLSIQLSLLLAGFFACLGWEVTEGCNRLTVL
jgi:hypothetical protein